MAEGGGEGFYSMLSELSFPHIKKYSPGTFEWLFEDERCREVLDYVTSHLTPENLVTKDELEAFQAIPPGDVLSGALLEEALEAAVDADAQLTAEDLTNEIAKLEAELGLQEERLETMSQVKQQLVNKTNSDAIALDTLRKEADQWTGEQRRKQEHVLEANASLNSGLASYSSSLERVISLHRRPHTADDALHLYELDLAKVWQVESDLDKELGVFISALFGSKFKELGLGNVPKTDDGHDENIGGLIEPGSDACLELIRGREKQEFLHLRSEISRVRVSIFKTEMQRIEMEAKDAGLRAKIDHLSRSLTGPSGWSNAVRAAGPVKPNLDSDSALQDQIAGLVAECVGCYCDMVLTTDYKLKHRRSVYVTNKMKIIRELLMRRRARQEVLDLLLAAETETILSIIDSVKNLEQNLEIRFRKREGFRVAASSLGSASESSTSVHLIPPSDALFSNLHSILRISGLVEPLATYGGVETAVRTLLQERKDLTDKIKYKQAGLLRGLEQSEAGIRELASALHIDLTAPLRSLSLVPSEVGRGMSVVERSLKDLEQKLLKLAKAWEANQIQLKTKPYFRLQRDLWIDFLLRPQLVPANVKAVVNKAKD